jgi:predicted kinase
VPTPPSSRSIKIDQDERGGWSSDGPRRDGAPRRPANLAVRCRVLAPAELLRYSPGSLMLVVSPVAAEADRFAQRLIEERGALLSLAKVRGLLAGRVDEEEVEARAAQLLDAAVAKRLEANESVVITVEGLEAETREHYVRMAAAHKRPCHIVLVETPREQVEEEDRATLNKLRKLLGAGDLGAEGFNTALRVMPNSMGEIKRIVFRPPPRDDD